MDDNATVLKETRKSNGKHYRKIISHEQKSLKNSNQFPNVKCRVQLELNLTGANINII